MVLGPSQNMSISGNAAKVNRLWLSPIDAIRIFPVSTVFLKNLLRLKKSRIESEYPGIRRQTLATCVIDKASGLIEQLSIVSRIFVD
jgi:hypothetical protein